MERQEQLNYCRACLNKTFDSKHGVICGLTNDFPTFEDSCPDYNPVGGKPLESIPVVEKKKYLIQTAGKELRFVNYLVDSFIASILFYMLLYLLKIDIEALMLDTFRLYAYTFLANYIYYFIFEVSSGKTPAKFITRTKVVMQNGEKPEIGAIAIRSLCRFIPFEAFSFLGMNDYGWHDSLSKTLVIKEN